LISDQFGFYHAGLFLLDETGEYAVLRAASSSGGQRMLARGHRLRVGEAGIVGYVTGRGEPRTALDVGKDAVYFDNPDLPETRSEVALPLRARGEIIGALDVQSTESEAFGQEDVTALQTLADQVAVAISNAHLFQQVQESLEAERRAYGQLSRQAWQDLIRSRAIGEHRYDPQGILPGDGRWRKEMEESVRTGQPIAGREGETATLALPLRVRDQVIGVLDAHKPTESGDWTPEEVDFLASLVDRLGVALDSARLYQETQKRATQERLVGEITARMRESLDLETVLRTATDQIWGTLGMSRVEIRLTPKDVTE
jgi:GAF domain-containing protein